MAACSLIKDRIHNDLPIEIWTEILSYLSRGQDVKNAMLTCKMFHPIARRILWAKPAFKKVLDLELLKELAELNVPIRELKLSQLPTTWSKPKNQGQSRFIYDILVSRSKISQICELVDFLSANFSLDGFHLDDHPSDSIYRWLTFEEFQYIVEKLPVKELGTGILLAGPDFYEFFNYLKEMDNCPLIIMDFRFIDDYCILEDVKTEVMKFVEKRFPESYSEQLRRDVQRQSEGEASWLTQYEEEDAEELNYFTDSDSDSDDSHHLY